jgi:hypothetical protein
MVRDNKLMCPRSSQASVAHFELTRRVFLVPHVMNVCGHKLIVIIVSAARETLSKRNTKSTDWPLQPVDTPSLGL